MTRKADLKDAPSGAFLYCPDCGAEWSATYGDYFMVDDDHEFTCWNEEHAPGLPMRLVTAQRVLTPCLTSR